MSTVFAAHARAHKLISELIARTNEFVRFHMEKNRKVRNTNGNSNTGGSSRRRNSDAGDIEDDGNDETIFRLTKQPSILTNCTMRDYQLEGLNWMIRLFQQGVSGILADEMGLGKTLQTISLLAYLRECQNIRGPHLILVPLSTLGNWCAEFKKFCPSINVLKFHGDKFERESIVEDIILPQKFEVLVTTFEMASIERSTLKKIKWRFLIVDEAHRLKNEHSVLSRQAREFQSTNRLLVTGTPLQNNLHELWALLNFLLPTIFSSAEDFDAMFSDVEAGAGIQRDVAATSSTIDQENIETLTPMDEAELEKQKEQFKADVLKKLHAILRPFMLRRMKADVVANLPPKRELLLYVGMTPLQRRLYKEVLVGNLDTVTGSCKIKTKLSNVVMQLRKASNHPYLFDGVEDLTLDPLGEHLVQNSGKMIVLDKLLYRLRMQGSRVLIFSQMTKVLDILEDYCRMRRYQYCRIDGNTSTEDREEGMEVFNKPNSEKFVFLLSTRAGGLGINLATADTVILFDSDWNPQMDLQAMDRAHRIGQKKPVNVYRFVTEDSIEERVITRAETKLRLDAMVIQQGSNANIKDKSMSSEDMVSMIRFGAERIFKATDTSNLSYEDIDVILQRGELKTQELNDKLQKFTGFNLSLSSSTQADDIYKLDESVELDVKTQKLMEEEAIKLRDGHDILLVNNPATNAISLDDEFLHLGKRERRENIDYDIDRYFREQFGEYGNGSSVKLIKPLRLPRMHEFQLFDIPRISSLCEKETKFYTKYITSAAPSPKPSGLTDEEIEERKVLLSEGFFNWKFSEYKNFLRACEKFGRDAYPKIARAIGTKTEEEVINYSKSFWKLNHRIKDHAKIIKAIVLGETKLKSSQITSSYSTRYVSSYLNLKDMLQRSNLRLRQTLRGRGYEQSDDITLLYSTIKYGYWDDWTAFRSYVHGSDAFLFHYFVKSRSANDLGRRIDIVTKNLMKNEEEEMKKNKTFDRSSSNTTNTDDKNSSLKPKKRGKPVGSTVLTQNLSTINNLSHLAANNEKSNYVPELSAGINDILQHASLKRTSGTFSMYNNLDLIVPPSIASVIKKSQLQKKTQMASAASTVSMDEDEPKLPALKLNINATSNNSSHNGLLANSQIQPIATLSLVSPSSSSNPSVTTTALGTPSMVDLTFEEHGLSSYKSTPSYTLSTDDNLLQAPPSKRLRVNK